MSLSTYKIEFPINKENSYQQLYRGRHENDQIFLLHIFPKQCLTQEMYDQIFHRVKQFEFVKEVLDLDEYIFVAYQDSAFWQGLEQKLKAESLKSYYIKLYQQYSKINGIVDFNQDYIFIKDDQLYIIDYGLDQFMQKKHKDLEYTSKTKTFLFGQMLLNLLIGKNLTDKIHSCDNQDQIDKIINHFTEGSKISIEIIENLLNMIKLDPHHRPTFEEVGQWKQFLFKNITPKVTQSIIDFSNTIIGQNNTTRQNQSQRSYRPQSQDLKELKDHHHQSVKAAINRQRRQAPSQGKIVSSSSYVVATQIVQNNLKKKRNPATGSVMSSIQTQQSFFQPGQQSYQMTQDSFSQFPKTQNQFFSKQPDSYQFQQQNSQKGFQTQSNQQQPVRVEKKQPFIFDGSQAPIQINKIQNQPQIQQSNHMVVQETPAPFFANPTLNQQFQQQPTLQQFSNTISVSKKTEAYQQQEAQQIQELMKTLPSSNPKKTDAEKNVKFKQPIVMTTTSNDDDIHTTQMDTTHVSKPQNQQQEIQEKQQSKKQEILKKPNDIKQLNNQKANNNEDLLQEQIKEDIQKQKSPNPSPRPQPQLITDIEEPPIIKPNKSLPQEQKQNKNENNPIHKSNSENQPSQRGQIQNPPPSAKPVQQNPPTPKEDNTQKFIEYAKKYTQYLQIIQYIAITVADIHEKIVLTSGAIWIVPLCIVFKRAYEIRVIMLEDMIKGKNIFQLAEFMKFKTSTQYEDLLNNITKQNNVMQQEFQQMLESAQQNIQKLDKAQQQKLSVLLSLDITNQIKDQAEKYLYTQLYPRVVTQIGKLKAGTSKILKYTLEEWLKTRLLCIYCILVMELDLYTIESPLFKEQILQQYRKSTNIDQIEQHCDQLEKKIKELPTFIK